MKITLFNRTKYESTIKKLEARKAPNYVIEAYHRGYTDGINLYYEMLMNPKRGNQVHSLNESDNIEVIEASQKNKHRFIQEALDSKDMAFLKAMYQVTNMDILTGYKKLPNNAGKLIKQGEIMDLGLTKLSKKLR